MRNAYPGDPEPPSQRLDDKLMKCGNSQPSRPVLLANLPPHPVLHV